MHLSGVQHKGNRKRAMAYIACGLFLILADVIFWARIAWAAPLYTPYANSVVGQSGLGSGTAGNAVGAPDGKTALLLGINSSLTLDMGEGEEGTGSLRVYFGPINLQVQMQVQFLDDAQAVIHSETRQLFLELTSTSQIFAYDWRSNGGVYRYVRINVLGAVAFGIDAVQALGFIGSSASQDTDGDGIPDIEDSDPLVPNTPAPSGSSGSSGGSSSGGGGSSAGSGGSDGSSSGGSGTTTTVIRTITTSSGSGATPVVNVLPSASDDQDGDQMSDEWERANGLDPTRNDAANDPDNDGPSNLREYQLDTNPKSADTDGDGIPDGWEVENGLNAKKDDALEDPDGDHITNLGEYHYGGNPYSADHVVELAAKINRKERLWAWVVFGGLLALAAAFLWRGLHAAARKRHEQKRPKSSAGAKSALPPR